MAVLKYDGVIKKARDLDYSFVAQSDLSGTNNYTENESNLIYFNGIWNRLIYFLSIFCHNSTFSKSPRIFCNLDSEFFMTALCKNFKVFLNMCTTCNYDEIKPVKAFDNAPLNGKVDYSKG